jgi:hypothetical protein
MVAFGIRKETYVLRRWVSTYLTCQEERPRSRRGKR